MGSMNGKNDRGKGLRDPEPQGFEIRGRQYPFGEEGKIPGGISVSTKCVCFTEIKIAVEGAGVSLSLYPLFQKFALKCRHQTWTHRRSRSPRDYLACDHQPLQNPWRNMEGSFFLANEWESAPVVCPVFEQKDTRRRRERWTHLHDLRLGVTKGLAWGRERKAAT